MSINSDKVRQFSKAKFDATYKLGLGSAKNLALIQDAELLANSIVTYLESKDPNFEFTDFFDPTLIKTMRNLIKNKDQFEIFLDTISFEVKDFLELSPYVIPTVFTSHLIRFIRKEYLGLNPIQEKRKPISKRKLQKILKEKEKLNSSNDKF